jgi:hypothetical protein
MHSRTAPRPGHTSCAHDHLVEFYESDEFLVATVTDFVVAALRGCDAVVVVATLRHRVAFAEAICAEGIDLDAAERDGRYQALDAAELLSSFMVDGAPDPVRFEQEAGAVIDRAAMDGRHVAIYGEMVALLWADGDVASTVALEDMWNDLAASRSFSLLCAYPLQAFDDSGRAAFRHICAQHSTVIPAEGYSLAMTADQQQRIVAHLQQETAALRAELRRRRRRAAQAAAADVAR